MEPLRDIVADAQTMLKEVKKSLYFWKNSPENNELYIRKELSASTFNEVDKRSYLGIPGKNDDWIEEFNIGCVMHMNPLSYEEFANCGNFLFEIS